MNPPVAFGMTLYNNVHRLPQAIESLLAQTDPWFGLVLLDDGSADATEAVARRYAASDPRVRYMRHAVRRGMVPTWSEVVELAAREFPAAQYFAWASDHDWWHPDWLGRVRAGLERHPTAVLAYALTQRVDDNLVPLDKPPKAFDTTALDNPAARVLAFAAEPVGVGDMVYGLVRLEALRRAGTFRPVIQPDRLLVLELALAGTFVQVPEVLWLRRQPAEASVTKQQTTLFADGEMPRGLAQPAWLQHVRVLLREYVAGPPPRGMSRLQVLALVVRYEVLYLFRHHNKEGYALHRLDKTRERLNQQRKEANRELRWAGYRTRRTLRPRHIARVADKYWLHVRNRVRYRAAVARRRARAALYETRMTARKQYAVAKRAPRKALHGILMLTHRLGLRGRS
jgi:glycosyltransferase involved in cell wall biosynthesis